MKKHLFGGLILLAGLCAYAGDAAAFVDLGISRDGKTYVFGEYGKTDKTFQGYAEIYTVDIAKNDFVKGEVFKVGPSAATKTKSGKDVFEEVKSKAAWTLKKYELAPAEVDNLLYIKDESKDGESEITFKDFEGSTADQNVFYHINLVKNVEGSGDKLYSSFFISLEKQDENGKLISRNIVGSPDVKRKCVTGYTIEKIFTDKSGRNLVFIVEKTVKDASGTSIRYMVETIRL